MTSIARIMPSSRRQRGSQQQRLVEPGPLDPGPSPAWATPAPTIPPTSAWLDDDGMPLSQVTTFQNIAPTSAPNTTAGVTRSLSISPLPIVSATLCRSWEPGKRQEIGREVEEGGEGDRLDRAEQLGRDHRRDRIGGVMQAVQKVERQRQGDQADQQRKSEFVHRSARPSAVVDDDAVDLVRDILERVDDPLEMLEDFALDDEVDRAWPSRCAWNAFLSPAEWISSAWPSIRTSRSVSSCKRAPLLPTSRSSGMRFGHQAARHRRRSPPCRAFPASKLSNS